MEGIAHPFEIDAIPAVNTNPNPGSLIPTLAGLTDNPGLIVVFPPRSP